ncbi:unnamed protein product [Penicillium pancosmium]
MTLVETLHRRSPALRRHRIGHRHLQPGIQGLVKGVPAQGKSLWLRRELLGPTTSDTSTTSGKPGSTSKTQVPTEKSSPPGSSEPSNTPNASNSSQSQTTSPSDSPTKTPSSSSSQSHQPNAQTSTSTSLPNSPDMTQISSMLATLTGASSAEVAAMLSHRPTDTATVAWADLASEMSQIPTGTTIGEAVATQGIELAGWLTNLNGNVQKANLKDKKTQDHVKTNLEEAGRQLDDYVQAKNSNTF